MTPYELIVCLVPVSAASLAFRLVQEGPDPSIRRQQGSERQPASRTAAWKLFSSGKHTPSHSPGYVLISTGVLKHLTAPSQRLTPTAPGWQ